MIASEFKHTKITSATEFSGHYMLIFVLNLAALKLFFKNA